MKKRIKDVIDDIDGIVADLEEIFDEEPLDMVMERSPHDLVLMFENVQDHIDNLRSRIDFILAKMGDEDFVEDYNDNESNLCDRCNKRLSRKERNR